MTIEERIARDAATWRDGYMAPPFDAAFERALATVPHRRRAWLAAAAAVVLVAAIGTFAATTSTQHRNAPATSSTQHRSTPTKPPAPSWTTHSLRGLATVRVPARWYSAPYRGAPAPVYFPLTFFSTRRLSGPCFAAHPPVTCPSQSWFPNGSTTPADGVLVLWSHAEFPGGPSLEHVPGQRRRIDHRPAKVHSGVATSCPSGAATELRAYVRAYAHAYPGERFDMTACLGAHVSAADQAAVYTMLRSLKIGKR